MYITETRHIFLVIETRMFEPNGGKQHTEPISVSDDNVPSITICQTGMICIFIVFNTLS